MSTAGLESTKVRRLVALGIGVLMLLSLLLPHVAVHRDGLFGRSLIPAGAYFVTVLPAAFGELASPLLAFALNITYLGLAMHQFGLVLAVLTFWVVAVDDINRWVWWMLSAGAWLLTLGGVTTVVGWVLIEAAGVPALLGLAWLPTMLAGLALVVESRLSKRRVDYTWFPTRPELQ